MCIPIVLYTTIQQTVLCVSLLHELLTLCIYVWMCVWFCFCVALCGSHMSGFADDVSHILMLWYLFVLFCQCLVDNCMNVCDFICFSSVLCIVDLRNEGPSWIRNIIVMQICVVCCCWSYCLLIWSLLCLLCWIVVGSMGPLVD